MWFIPWIDYILLKKVLFNIPNSECQVRWTGCFSQMSCRHWVTSHVESKCKCAAPQQTQPITQPLVDAMRWFEATGGGSICSRVLDLGHERPTFTALQFIFVEGKMASSVGRLRTGERQVLLNIDSSVRRVLFHPVMLKVCAFSLLVFSVKAH